MKKQAFIAAGLVCALAIASLIGFLVPACAHSPALQVPTTLHITVSPNPVHVDQTVNVSVTVDPAPPTATIQGGDRWSNLKVNITRPDGLTKVNGPFATDSNGTFSFLYTPAQTGTHVLTAIFPGQVLSLNNPLSGATGVQSEYVGDTFQASSAVTSLSVENPAYDTIPSPVPTTPSNCTPVQDFTLRYVDHSYDVAPVPTSSTDPYTGMVLNWTIPGRHVDGQTVEAVIKNPQGAVFYNFRYKEHFADGWKYMPFNPNDSLPYFLSDSYSVPFQASNSTYSELSLYFLAWEHVSAGGQIDVQVQALYGYFRAVPYVHIAPIGPTYDFYFNGSASEWSTTQTITIPSSPSSSPPVLPTPTPSNTFNPTLQLFCQSSASYTNFRVEITGSLTSKDSVLANFPVQLSYSVDGGTSWTALTQVLTDSHGNFSAVWLPSFSGNNLLKAGWLGNDTYAPMETTVSLAVVAEQESVFSVSSNSTLTDLAFNSTSRELSFTVGGPTDTTGFTEVRIPKSLVSDVSALRVRVDGNEHAYAIASQADAWVITLQYHHSIHQVTVNINGFTASISVSGGVLEEIAIVALAVAVAALAVGLVAVVKKRKPASTLS
jgi:hypothetical protein